jgi:hypothetical protein
VEVRMPFSSSIEPMDSPRSMEEMSVKMSSTRGDNTTIK